MKNLIHTFNAVIIAMALALSGCATSYQDRADALAGEGEGEPAADHSLPGDDGDAWSSDIPLSGACIINADCTSTQFCELGRCTSECSQEEPCSEGLFCSTRGKCYSNGKHPYNYIATRWLPGCPE